MSGFAYSLVGNPTMLSFGMGKCLWMIPPLFLYKSKAGLLSISYKNKFF